MSSDKLIWSQPNFLLTFPRLSHINLIIICLCCDCWVERVWEIVAHWVKYWASMRLKWLLLCCSQFSVAIQQWPSSHLLVTEHWQIPLILSMDQCKVRCRSIMRRFPRLKNCLQEKFKENMLFLPINNHFNVKCRQNWCKRYSVDHYWHQCSKVMQKIFTNFFNYDECCCWSNSLIFHPGNHVVDEWCCR